MSEYKSYDIEDRELGLVAVFQRQYPQLEQTRTLDGDYTASRSTEVAFNESSLQTRIENMEQDQRDTSLEREALVTLQTMKAKNPNP